MDSSPQNKNEVVDTSLLESVRSIANMYVLSAERYLEDGDPLRERIVQYYSRRPETKQELLNVLGKMNDKEKKDYILDIKDFTQDSFRFIERMEKLYELQDVHNRRRESASKDRPATKDEYELGAYEDVLESQIKEAVISARKKGYLTFQSGFREKSDRDQFMDFYNKNIVIPNDTLEYLNQLSIETKIENFDDRTTLTLHPVGNKPIRLEQWKEVWNTLVESLAQADPETVPNMKQFGEHVDFRKKQDSF